MKINLQKYSEYKDSGVEWLGEIPSGWEVIKLKHLLKFSTGGTPSSQVNGLYDGDIPWVTISDIDGRIIKNSHFISKKGVKFANITPTPKGSLLYSFKLSVGQVAFTEKNIYTNEAIASFYPIEKVNLNFWFYVLPIFLIKNANTNIYGAYLLNQDLIKNAIIIAPPVPEQTAIANFLDRKTVLIDQAVDIKQKQIELLKERRQILIHKAVTRGLNPNAKLKDSGVEWIGKIPEGWEVKRLKEFCKAFGRIGFRGYTTSDLVSEGEGAITISPSNIKGEFMTFEKCSYLSWNKYRQSPEIQIFEDDILMVKTGSTFGKTGIVKNLPHEATINPQLIVLKEIKINSDYFYTLLKASMVQYQVQTEVIGSTIPTISETKILNFKVALPQKSEMEEILKYIETATAKIATAISLKEQEIEKLKEYKATLINSAVTGKIKISNYAK